MLRLVYEIEGLVVIGPREIEQSCKSSVLKSINNLPTGWCEYPPIPWDIHQLANMVHFCNTSRWWNTQPVLWLALPKIGGMPTTLRLISNLWKGRGWHEEELVKLPQSLQQSNDSNVPLTARPEWKIGFRLPPVWTERANYQELERLCHLREITISSVTSAAWMNAFYECGHMQLFHNGAGIQKTSTFNQPGRIYTITSYESHISIETNSEDQSVEGYGAAVEGFPRNEEIYPSHCLPDD